MDRRFVARRARALFAAADRDPRLRRKPEVILFRNATEPHLDMGFFYVTGLLSGIYEGSTVVVSRPDRVDLVTSPLEETSARREGGFHVHVPGARTKEAAALAKVAGRPKVVGVNATELTHASFLRLRKTFPKSKFVDVSGAVLEARLIKDAKELEHLRQAAAIASRVAEKIPTWLRAGVLESDLAAKIAYHGGTLGAAGTSFDTICAFGPNSAEPHYTQLSRRLRRNEFALFDFGFRYRRYCSDITRTFFYGRPSKRQRKMYETVRYAQQAALDLVHEGANGRDVHHAAERAINRTEFKGRFIHGLGHGLGLAVHDGGSLSGARDFTLRAAMVVTVEPGIYVPRHGGVRIEDDILVTKTGYRFLTTAPRELHAVA